MILNGSYFQTILELMKMFLLIIRNQRIDDNHDDEEDLLLTFAMVNNMSVIILRIANLLFNLMKGRVKKRRNVTKPHHLIKLLHAYR